MGRESHAVAERVAAGDSWYTEEHLRQLDNPATRDTLESRWRVFAAQLAKLAPAQRTLRILDAGCGDGVNLAWLCRYCDQHDLPAEVYGCDYNPLRVARARELPGTAGVVECELAGLPFDSDFFDVVLCNQVLEHIPDLPPVLAEFHRVGASGCTYILCVPNEGCALAQLRNRRLQPFLMESTDHVNFFTAATFSSVLQAARFAVDRVAGIGFFYPHTRMHAWFKSRSAGRRLTRLLADLLPGQAADLVAVVHKA
ncbi:MAG: class I SAM-dependent methyltransferase [Gammaproteobacteria bacterium]|nr:class I SAM-dependent methyltransferase [Gammaproteobacteria bacterium]